MTEKKTLSSTIWTLLGSFYVYCVIEYIVNIPNIWRGAGSICYNRLFESFRFYFTLSEQLKYKNQRIQYIF